MNIRYTMTAYLPYIGGSQIYTHRIAQECLADGHRVSALAFWNENRGDWLLGTTLRAPRDPQPYQLDGVQVDRIRLPLYRRATLVPWVATYYPIKPLALLPIARAIYPQVCAASSGFDLIHNVRIGREPLSVASLWAARAHDVPFCITALLHPKWLNWYDQPYHTLYRAADAVMALTPAEKEMLVRIGVREERITITGMGPNVEPTADPQAFRKQHTISGPMVLFLAEKRSYKGFQQLTEAARIVWRTHPDTHVVFIGPRTNASRAFFANVTDPRLLELDAVSNQAKTNALAACDILCVPSTQESFGGVYAEAWTQRKPVIGCDIPAVRAVIDDGVNGFLVQQNAADIAEKLIHLLDAPHVRVQQGLAGHEKVVRHYSWASIYQRTHAAYQRVLRGA